MISKERFKEIIQHYEIKATNDMKDSFKKIFGEMIQEIIESEIELRLCYVKQ